MEGGRLRGSWCGDCLAIRMGEDINEVGLCLYCVWIVCLIVDYVCAVYLLYLPQSV